MHKVKFLNEYKDFIKKCVDRDITDEEEIFKLFELYMKLNVIFVEEKQ